MQPRHKIDDKYNNDPRHIRQWGMTIEWLKQFNLMGRGLDCGDRTPFTDMIEQLVIDDALHYTNHSIFVSKEKPYKYISARDTVHNTEHDLNSWQPSVAQYDNVFIFEVIEHLLNPLLLIEWIKERFNPNGTIYLSTPINRPNWMRNKELHFHEFNYNELMYLIDTAGFKVVDEKIINPTPFSIGFRPILRMLGIGGRNILLRLKRK